MDELILQAATSLGTLDALVVYGVGFCVLLACGFGLPVPEDITLLTMGYATYLPLPDGSLRPHASVGLAVLIGYAGVMIGDAFVFSLGGRFGPRLAERRPFRWVLPPQRLEAAGRLFTRRGPQILFAARFMPGLRSVVFFTAGSLGTPYRRFALYDGLAALLSVPALVVAGWYFGSEIHRAITWARHFEHGIVLLIAAIVAVWIGKTWWRRRRSDRAAGVRWSLIPPRRPARGSRASTALD